MIPILFSADTNNFTTGSGLGGLTDCTSCQVTEERNGIFECEFKYPVNGPMFKRIKPGCIVYVPYDVSGTNEPFDIYGYSVDLTGVATYRARHISYRLNGIVYHPEFAHQGWMASPSALWNLPTYLTEQSQWLTHLNKLPNAISFTIQQIGFTSEDQQWYVIHAKSKSLRDVLIGANNSITAQGGVEMRWRYANGRIYGDMMKKRGTDTTAVIRVGQNLSGLQYEYDESDYRDAVIPYYVDSEGDVKLLSDLDNGQGITADYIGVPDSYRLRDRFSAILLDTSSELRSTTPTSDDLETRALEYYRANCLKGGYENLTINFEPLWQSSEYPKIAPAEKLKLCDTAQVVIPELGINKRMKVCKTVWNVLENRYARLEFGTAQRTIYTVNYDNNTAEETAEGTVIIPDEEIPISE